MIAAETIDTTQLTIMKRFRKGRLIFAVSACLLVAS